MRNGFALRGQRVPAVVNVRLRKRERKRSVMDLKQSIDVLLTCAFGRVRAALDRSHKMSLQSSPTLAKRIVRSSERQGSQAIPVTHDECP